MHKITPFLWFDNNVEEAMNFYKSIFPDSEIRDVKRYGEGAPLPAGSVITANFRLCDQEFMALNGGPQFKFNEAVSLFVNCENQQEVDDLWGKLLVGGEAQQCGWLKDKFGLFWQIIPRQLGELLGDPDPAKSNRVMQAMLTMQKIDVATLEQAHSQE